MQRTARVLMVLLGLLVAAGPATASMYPLEHVIPKGPATRLNQMKIRTSEDLLRVGDTRAHRAKLAGIISVAEKQLAEWVLMCDLLRVRGVGPRMTLLLGAAGVTSVAALQKQTAKSLYDRVIKANQKAKITENPPSEKHLEHWIAQAKKLKIVVQ